MFALLLLIAQKLVIPEVMEYVAKRQADTGKVPTVEEVQANFVKTITDGITKGENWLSSNPAK